MRTVGEGRRVMDRPLRSVHALSRLLSDAVRRCVVSETQYTADMKRGPGPSALAVGWERCGRLGPMKECCSITTDVAARQRRALLVVLWMNYAMVGGVIVCVL